MKFHKNRLLTTGAAVALALAVGACSSSSDDDEMAGTPPTATDMAGTPPATTDPAPELTPAEQLTAAQELVTAADALVAALTSDSTADDAAKAYAALGAAQTALHAANSLPENKIAAKQAEIDALQAQVDQLTIDLAEATKEPDAPTAAMIAATAAAGTKVKAIGVEADQGADTDAGIGGSVPVDVDTTYTMTIERPRSGTVVKIVDSANAEDDDPKFTLAMDLGKGRTMHTRKMEADEDGNVVEEVVIVSTDIAAPKATAFADEYPLLINPNAADPPVFQSLTVDNDNVGMWSSAEFPSTPDTTREYAQDNEDTADVNEAAIMGMFDGGPGTFECLSTGCSIETDEDGKLEMVEGTWRFTPGKGAKVDVADTDFLNYGFWLKKTTDEDGVLTYNEVETFAGFGSRRFCWE